MRWPVVACLLLVLLAGVASVTGEGRAGYITVTYPAGQASPADHDRLIEVLEKARGRADGHFGTCPGHIEVIVVDDRAMDEEAGEQVDAFSAWNKMMSAVVLRRGSLGNTSLPFVVEHEMAHLAINEILCKKDPREFQWMEEGICTVFSGEPLSDADVSAYIAGHGFIKVDDIRDAINNENCTISKNGYMQSYSLVRHMVKRYGMGAVLNMLECPEPGLDEAFRQSTGEDFRAFYEEWKDHVRKNTPK